ncbi:hypothetical protein PMAYCL1PPCAC_19067, partial [Pristionchus mayeri]
DVRSRDENSEFVRFVRTKITEETRRCADTRTAFWLDPTLPEGWITLDQYLNKHGPFPVDSYFAASITQQVAGALLFLHQSKIVYGNLTAQSIVIDMDGAVHVLPPPTNWRHSMQGDIWLLGKLLLRLVSGQSEYPPPPAEFPVDQSLIKLVGQMLHTPMTAGQVRHHSTVTRIVSQKPSMFFFNQ